MNIQYVHVGKTLFSVGDAISIVDKTGKTKHGIVIVHKKQLFLAEQITQLNEMNFDLKSTKILLEKNEKF